MAWVWTKQFSSLDDGTALTGLELQNLQTDIVGNSVDLTSAQTITGDKTFSGSVVFNGTLVNVAKVSEFVVWDDEIISWENELVVYQ
jgi:hypothetical protein